jgi:hypothetical protein
VVAASPRWQRASLVTAAAIATVVLVAAVALQQFERISCESQMMDGPNRPGSNCGYQLNPSLTAFRYAIDDGSQRLLYLSGGANGGPDAIRLTARGTVAIERPTSVLTKDTVDVCRNQPPRDARWWSATIDDTIAAAIRRGDTSVYLLEAWADGQWRPLELHDSGCRWKGMG